MHMRCLLLTNGEEEGATPVSLLWSVEIRVQDVKGYIHMIPVTKENVRTRMEEPVGGRTF